MDILPSADFFIQKLDNTIKKEYNISTRYHKTSRLRQKSWQAETACRNFLLDPPPPRAEGDFLRSPPIIKNRSIRGEKGVAMFNTVNQFPETNARKENCHPQKTASITRAIVFSVFILLITAGLIFFLRACFGGMVHGIVEHGDSFFSADSAAFDHLLG